MSYVPKRDNPLLADVDDTVWARLEQLVDEADEAAFPGQHQDACACTDPDCKILANIRTGAGLGFGADPVEALAFAYARGLLRLDGAS